MSGILQFVGRNRFLSNFYPALVMLDGHQYATVEHAYQAAKFPQDQREPFRQLIKPGQAKRLGRGKGGPDWRNRSLAVMEDLLWQKFEEPSLKKLLLATGDEHLEEGNDWHDTFYGVCNGQCWSGPHKPIGENHLGWLLMRVRDGMQNGCRPSDTD